MSDLAAAQIGSRDSIYGNADGSAWTQPYSSVDLRSVDSESNSDKELQADLTAADVDRLIGKIIELIDKRFVDIPAGKKVVAGITKYYKDGKYKNIKTNIEFISVLNKDLYALSNDLHLTVRPIDQAAQNSSGPQRVVRRQAPGGQGTNRSGTNGRRMMGNRMFQRPSDGHFTGRVLHGSIGYVKVNGVLAPIEGTKIREDMESALQAVKNTDAVIFDLRNVPGGVPETVSLLSSYLYDDRPMHLNTYHNRLTDPREMHTRPNEVPFHLGVKRPVYVLINGSTASGGEAFTYINQQHGRVTVVGETSRGAGRLSVPHPISDKLFLLVPENRSEHPVSKTGFEQIGVIPEIKVKSADSLSHAHTTALNNLLKRDPGNKKWKSALTKIDEDKKSIGEKLGEYAGVYGERTVAISGNGLVYYRAGQPELALQEIAKDKYKILLPAGVRSRNRVPTIRFDRDEKGKIKSLSLVAKDGSNQGTFLRSK
jgi:hypothetical protein